MRSEEEIRERVALLTQRMEEYGAAREKATDSRTREFYRKMRNEARTMRRELQWVLHPPKKEQEKKITAKQWTLEWTPEEE